jgi:hypothetical protein
MWQARGNRNAYVILVEKPEARKPLSKPNADGRITLNCSQTEWENKNWIYLASCEHGTGSPSSIRRADSWSSWGLVATAALRSMEFLVRLLICFIVVRGLAIQLSCAMQLTSVSWMKWWNTSVNKHKYIIYSVRTRVGILSLQFYTELPRLNDLLF